MPIIEKQGYKCTEEFGYIPDDWNLIALEDITTRDGLVRGPFGGALKKEYFVNNGYKVYEQGNAIYQTIDFGSYYINEEKFKELKRFEVKGGDYIVSCSGTIGKIFRLPLCIPKGVINQALLKITLDETKMNADFFLIIFNCSKFQSSIIDSTQGGAMKNLVGMPIFKQSKILCPSLPEQEKIAEVLGDVDSLIDKTQQLINKKKDLKTATMQKLLTSKEDWVTYKLGDCSKICTGNENNENKVEDGLYPFFVRSENIERINTYSYDGEAILVPGEGGIGKIFHYINGRFNYHQRVYKISDFRYIDGKYTYYYMKKYFGKYALSNTVKATVDSLRLPTFEEFNIKCPELAEQKMISQTISDMDSEIEALEKELNKYKDLKTGMMQQLLTGKVRLI